ncbi:hypothetical protein ABOM_006834 [Aspergillus bombycis]|uniref:Fungal-type protein kinase domain-containing protein n=1 Tax=Aspergillus bombycis TaxID=109264 RepID=A0A1F7ZZ52_9EURO|nr:hypothetical protein ABOM_006834 [Aspergillus bombycis]OGM44375.1 hypothetical protein ABOM_006834 [Aspergillus bombycis]
MFPPTKDEQIVNAALIIFLDALTIHFGDFMFCNWTIHRKGFIANFTKASFEARTDGYLDDGEENAYALIEVKPATRSKTQNLIQMQESAQMVGWLINDSEENNIGKIRILISQGRHEIFLTFAEYDDRYLAYLKNEPFQVKPSETGGSQNEASRHQMSAYQAPGTGASSFLTMHQYGPWNTQQRTDMARLGPILLAITLYAEGEIQAKKRSQRK